MEVGWFMVERQELSVICIKAMTVVRNVEMLNYAKLIALGIHLDMSIRWT